MTLDCVFSDKGCWLAHPLPAPTTFALVLLFVSCAAMVFAATLPGKTRVLLGPSEDPRRSTTVLRAAAYAAWTVANAALAWMLWGAIFPSDHPRTLLVYETSIITGLPCDGKLLDSRCLQAAVLRSLGSADGEVEEDVLAEALLKSAGSRVLGSGERAQDIGDDAAAYAQLLRVPVSDLYVIGREGSAPESVRNLAPHWPMVDRYAQSLEGTGRAITNLPPVRVTTPESCIVAHPAENATGLQVHFCLLTPKPHIDSILAVYGDASDVVVEIAGDDLPPRVFASIGGTPFTPPIEGHTAGARHGVLILPGQAPLLQKPGALSVALNATDNTGPQPIKLPLKDPKVCLRLEGRSLSDIDFASLPKFLSARILGLLKAGCDDGLLFVARNGAILRAPTDELHAIAVARALAPTREAKVTIARVLDPAFDVSPGILDDSRLANFALSTGQFLVESPMVVREVPLLRNADSSLQRYYDASPNILFKRDKTLAPIIAWVEAYDESIWSGKILAGAFGQSLWEPSEKGTQLAAWGALVSMANYPGAASTMHRPDEAPHDRLGAALENAYTSGRFRTAFLALAGWMILRLTMHKLIR